MTPEELAYLLFLSDNSDESLSQICWIKIKIKAFCPELLKVPPNFVDVGHFQFNAMILSKYCY